MGIRMSFLTILGLIESFFCIYSTRNISVSGLTEEIITVCILQQVDLFSILLKSVSACSGNVLLIEYVECKMSLSKRPI